MRILKQGDKGQALCPTCRRRQATTYEYRTVRLRETGVDVDDVLVGVCDVCGEIVSIPAQSTPRLKEARDAKLATVNARIPRHLDDALHMVVDRYGASTQTFASTLLRYYLNQVARSEPFARRVQRLARDKLAHGKADARVSLRLSEQLWAEAWREAREVGIQSQAELFKGVIIAALEDCLHDRAPARRRVLSGIAAVA